MKKYFALLVTLVVALFASASFAYTPPAPTGFVTDTMGVMSAAQVKVLNSKISALKASTKNEIGILVIPTVGDESISDVAHHTFKAWKIGAAGLDNGVLIVMAINSRKMRIQTGKGVEGDLPDILTADIQKKMVPFMKSNDVSGALNVAVDDISARLESRKGQKADDAGAGAQFNKPLPAPTDSTSVSTTTTTRPQTASCDASGAGLSTGGSVFILFVLLSVGGLIWFFRNQARKERLRQEEEERERNRRLAEKQAARERALADERALQAARKKRAEELEAQRIAEAQTLPRVVVSAPVLAPTRKATADDLRKVLTERAANKQVYVPVVPRPTPRVEPVVTRTVPATTVSSGSDAAAAALATELAAQRLRDEQERVERERARERREREAEEASRREHQEAEARRERERQEREYEAQARRERDEEERRARRQREREEEEAAAAIAAAAAAAVATYTSYSSDDSSSSSSSSSSWSSSDSSSSSSDSGFGGGDSGGGGSDSSW